MRDWRRHTEHVLHSVNRRVIGNNFLFWNRLAFRLRKCQHGRQQAQQIRSSTATHGIAPRRINGQSATHGRNEVKSPKTSEKHLLQGPASSCTRPLLRDKHPGESAATNLAPLPTPPFPPPHNPTSPS